MKSRKLIVANTYYQVIFAIQMKLTIFREDKVELIITDHTPGSHVICNRLKKLDRFDNVYFVNAVSSGENRNKVQKICDALSISFLKNNRFCYYTNQIINKSFDEILVFNYDMRTYGIFSILAEKKKDIKVSRFEEGILSYSTERLFTPTRTLVGYLRKFVGNPVIEEAFSYFYCFYPELYKGGLSAKKVPLIKSTSEIKNILQTIFNFNETNLRYAQKYIFFTSVYDFEGGKPVGEYKLVCQIAELVGKDNLLVKMHPRDVRTIYKDNGFNVDQNSSIPWEVIQLSSDFSDKVFMTINSGSVIAGSTMSEKPVTTYYMYRLCDIEENPSCLKNARDIEALLNFDSMREVLKTVKIVERLEEIL